MGAPREQPGRAWRWERAGGGRCAAAGRAGGTGRRCAGEGLMYGGDQRTACARQRPCSAVSRYACLCGHRASCARACATLRGWCRRLLAACPVPPRPPPQTPRRRHVARRLLRLPARGPAHTGMPPAASRQTLAPPPAARTPVLGWHSRRGARRASLLRGWMQPLPCCSSSSSRLQPVARPQHEPSAAQRGPLRVWVMRESAALAGRVFVFEVPR